MHRLIGALFLFLLVAAPATAQSPRRQNVVLIVTDGFRWQELFGGADPALNNAEYGGVEDTAALRRAFLVGDKMANSRALMPFMWSVIARDGQILGDRDLGSTMVVTNGYKFSYPGYNEMLTGKADPRIDRNDYGPNPNVTVFEWLAGKPEFTGKVAAFGTWDVFATDLQPGACPDVGPGRLGRALSGGHCSRAESCSIPCTPPPPASGRRCRMTPSCRRW